MKVHHLSCGTLCPYGGRHLDGASPGLGPTDLVCHCLLIETESGLVLVDTGLGLLDIQCPEERLGGLFRRLMRPAFDESQTAIRQIERMGFKAADVRHILLTHLDFDHAGGLTDFPRAQVHLMADELTGARTARGVLQSRRFRPAQWRDVANWNLYDERHGEEWFGFSRVRELRGLPPEILMIPLVGHTLGHAGIAIQTDRGWLLHAGDAYFCASEIDPVHPRTPLAAALLQRVLATRPTQCLENRHHLRGLAKNHGADVRIFCAHDRSELEHIWTEERDRAPLTSRHQGPLPTPTPGLAW